MSILLTLGWFIYFFFFFFQAEDGIRDADVTGVQTCALPIYRDWKRSGHGKVNLERAIVESCDVYFYEMAVRAGIDNLTPFLAQFGFGRNMASDIRYALPGILPGREWKRDNRRSFWFAGDTVNLGIGQGYMLVTPLQLATATAVLANNGRWNVPRLIYAQDHEIVEIEHGDIPDIELENPQD